MERDGQRGAETVLMLRIAERLAGAACAESGLAGVVSLLSRFLKADLGVFLVRNNEEWLAAGHGAHDELRRTLPRTPRLAVRAEQIALADITCRPPSGGRAEAAAPPDSVVVPVRAGRRFLGYGVFRTGKDRIPPPGTLRLLDAVGAQLAAFCECISRGDRADAGKERLDRLVRSNQDLGWLLAFSESLHSHADPDSMFKWLARELGYLAPVLGVELVSLPEGPVVRVASDLAAKVSAHRDGAAIVGEWADTLSSRHGVRVPEGEFRLKRFPCLPVADHAGGAGSGRPEVWRVEAPMHCAGRLVGVLAACFAADAPEGRRIDEMAASAAGQVGLFLHKYADREKIRFLANHDALTGLLNHLSFQNIFEREFERHRRHERNLSLLFVDIDRFKRINDDFGHQVGDRVLREVARVLTANLRKIDYVFRYGGDEFVVLMTETDSQRASMLAHRIRGAVKREIGRITPSRSSVSISIGIADCGTIAPAEREELLFRADEALYQAKNGGRDQVRVAEPPVDLAAGVN